MQKSKDEPILPGCSVMLEAVYHVLLQMEGVGENVHCKYSFENTSCPPLSTLWGHYLHSQLPGEVVSSPFSQQPGTNSKQGNFGFASRTLQLKCWIQEISCSKRCWFFFASLDISPTLWRPWASLLPNCTSFCSARCLCRLSKCQIKWVKGGSLLPFCILHLSSISQYRPLQSLWRELIAAILAAVFVSARACTGSNDFTAATLPWVTAISKSSVHRNSSNRKSCHPIWSIAKKRKANRITSQPIQLRKAFLVWFILPYHPYPSCHVPLVLILHRRCASHLAVSIQSRSPSRTFVRDWLGITCNDLKHHWRLESKSDWLNSLHCLAISINIHQYPT